MVVKKQKKKKLMNLNQETLIEIVDQGILEAKNKIYTQRQNDKKKEKESGGLSWSLVSSITNNPHLNLFFFFFEKVLWSISLSGSSDFLSY